MFLLYKKVVFCQELTGIFYLYIILSYKLKNIKNMGDYEKYKSSYSNLSIYDVDVWTKCICQH